MKQPINHGTVGGYKTHRRRQERPCRQCDDARKAYDKSRKHVVRTAVQIQPALVPQIANPTTQDWAQVICRNDPDTWDPDRTHPAEAKNACLYCPLRDACLQLGLEGREPWGIWGGTSPEERAWLLKRRQAA